jgi:hypothetical protein
LLAAIQNTDYLSIIACLLVIPDFVDLPVDLSFSPAAFYHPDGQIAVIAFVYFLSKI